MNQYRVGIIGATGMVGQRFISLLKDHPWFKVTCLAASARSAGKTYREAVGERWAFDWPIPDYAADMTIVDASDIDAVAAKVDFCFCAVDMKKDEIRALEEDYARHEVPIVSNNSACRGIEDVPMVVPEINAAHLDVIPTQRKRLGSKYGFIAVKPNCSIQSYVPALTPLLDFEPTQVSVCTYQAISGAGKTFKTWPEMVDNVIPYIGGEDEKSENEPLKLWGTVKDLGNGPVIVNAASSSGGRTMRRKPSGWNCPARRNPSCSTSTILPGRRPGWTAISRTASGSASAGCGKTGSLTGALSA